MAALQKIRSKGPLLIGVIALGLFAFIAGDAWRVITPHQSQDAGEVDGEAISAQDYQSMVEEYSNALKFAQGLTALSEEQNDQVKDEVWNQYVNGKLIEKEAKELGLVVSDAEIQDIINQGSHALLSSLPFKNQQTGAFDKDMLNMFLVSYSSMNAQNTTPDMLQYYQELYGYWTFIEKMLRQTRLAEKYQALLTNALLSNDVEAQMAFDARTNQTDFLMAAIPYSSVLDADVAVTDAELKAAYENKKEQYRQEVETRDIRYVDVQVVASDEDRAELQKEMDDYTAQLNGEVADYTTFIRQTGSELSFVDLFTTSRVLPSDVVARLDSVEVGKVCGPYYNASDNTMNTFKKVAQAQMPDSIEFRQIQVVANTQAARETLADSIYTALKDGADFATVAQKYGQTGAANWISSANYEGAQIDADNMKYINTIVTTPQNQLVNLSLNQANIILLVTNRAANTTKYKVAVVKRAIEFSKETYNKMYNDFSEFVATNNTFDKMVQNAEEAGYRLYTQGDVYSSAHNLSSIPNTKDALKWVFAAKPGETSGLFECGDRDRLLMVGLARVNKVGYRSIDLVSDELKAEIIRDKKAANIMETLKSASSFDQYKSLPNAVSDSIKRVTFSAPAYVASMNSAETVLSAAACNAKMNQLVAPMKGNVAVYVLQAYSQNKTEETFNAETEKARQQNLLVNIARQQFAADLYKNAKVVDSRYLFF